TTCNRAEFIFTSDQDWSPDHTSLFLSMVQEKNSFAPEHALEAEYYHGEEALEHLIRVACSLESLVIGEREIITQFRKAYEDCRSWGLTGDHIRLAVKHCIETAKEVHTRTQLTKKPVSVSSMAWKNIREYAPAKETRILMIGAGQVMKSICKFLSENDYSSVTMFNRTLSHATDLMIPLGGHAHDLEELIAYRDGFDVLIVCTASTEPIITSQVYKALTAQSAGDKMIVDLALPANVADDVAHLPGVTYLGMEQIRQEVSRNVTDREEALLACLPIIQEAVISFRSIFRQRQIEIRMSEIPTAIKQIRTTALKEVFAADVEQLDEKSKEVLNNIVDYFEKKYISVPMKLAREVLLDASSQNTSPQ
ncbi:MAG: hypothetical protein RL220_1088, partial [Bacteroidota bacterium]